MTKMIETPNDIDKSSQPPLCHLTRNKVFREDLVFETYLCLPEPNILL